MDKSVAFPANLVVCPACQNQFQHNKVNGLAIIEVLGDISARKRMYCRLTLDSLERLATEKTLTFTMIKKIVLDNFNDFDRDIHTMLGFGEDDME
jgi:hypothetical protein